MREHPTADVFAAAVPENIDPGDPAQRAALIVELDLIAKSYVWSQWRGQRLTPTKITHMISEWCITNKPDEIETFQPAHDCAECLAGNELARNYLRDNPGRWVALANLNYIEYWRD